MAKKCRRKGTTAELRRSILCTSSVTKLTLDVHLHISGAQVNVKCALMHALKMQLPQAPFESIFTCIADELDALRVAGTLKRPYKQSPELVDYAQLTGLMAKTGTL